MSSLLPTTDETLGAASIGFSVSCVLFGIVTMQTFIYYQNFYNDMPGYRILVAVLWLLQCTDQIFIGYSIYHYLITKWGNFLALFTEDIVWPLLSQVILGNVVGTIVKACFAFRVWRFSRGSLWITGPLVVLITGQLACGIAYIIKGFQLQKLIFAGRLRLIATISLGAGAITDAGIAIVLSVLLHRLRTGWKHSDSIINVLIVYAVNTGALTCITSIVTVLLYQYYGKTFYFMASYFLLGKFYAITLLAALNTRASVGGAGTDAQQGPGTSTGLLSSGHGHASGRGGSRGVVVGVSRPANPNFQHNPYHYEPKQYEEFEMKGRGFV